MAAGNFCQVLIVVTVQFSFCFFELVLLVVLMQVEGRMFFEGPTPGK